MAETLQEQARMVPAQSNVRAIIYFWTFSTGMGFANASGIKPQPRGSDPTNVLIKGADFVDRFDLRVLEIGSVVEFDIPKQVLEAPNSPRVMRVRLVETK